MNSIFLPSVLILQSIEVVEWKYFKKFQSITDATVLSLECEILKMLIYTWWLVMCEFKKKNKKQKQKLRHGSDHIEFELTFGIQFIYISVEAKWYIKHLHYTFWSPAIHKGSLCHGRPTLALWSIRATQVKISTSQPTLTARMCTCNVNGCLHVQQQCRYKKSSFQNHFNVASDLFKQACVTS